MNCLAKVEVPISKADDQETGYPKSQPIQKRQKEKKQAKNKALKKTSP
jgi:hypothetical protein